MLLRWKISVAHEKELTVAIIKAFKEKNTHLISMEETPHAIFVKFDVPKRFLADELKESLLQNPNIHGIYLIDVLPQEQGNRFDDILYQSSKMEQLVNIAKKIAPTDCTVLIHGDSGTGKELFARAIHQNSSRKINDFIPINCAALPENLLESELFGYEEGAFSGAKKNGSKGLFELAHNSTLFLDEIAELSLLMQAKLLRVLQEKKIRRLGGRKFIDVDVRIIAATNKNLEQMVREGTFREDLYYRLNVVRLEIPPLRERPEDIPVLIDYLLDKYNHKLGKNLDIAPETRRVLLSYHWPGNVRELENVIERAIILADEREIQPTDLMIVPHPTQQKTNRNFQEIDDIDSLKEYLAEVEKSIIMCTLKKEGSARAAARALGLSHTAILKKIHLYGLDNQLKSLH